jgi:hypothetical protein
MPKSIVSHLESFIDLTSFTRLAGQLVGQLHTIECAMQCPYDVKRLFDDITTDDILLSASNAVVEWRSEKQLSVNLERIQYITDGVYLIYQLHAQCRGKTQKTIDSSRVDLKQLGLSDKRMIADYAKPMICLVLLTQFEFLKVSRITAQVCDDLRAALTSCDQHDSELTIHGADALTLAKATHLLRLCCNGPGRAKDLVFLFLAGVYLRYLRRCTRGKNHSLHCLATVYMAVMYLVTGHVKKAIPRCDRVIRSSQVCDLYYQTHVVEGRCLPKISNDIDEVCGLVTFYCYLMRASLNQAHSIYANVFTISLFARYLKLQSHGALRNCGVEQLPGLIEDYQLSFRRIPNVFVGDLMLLYIIVNRAKKEDHRVSKMAVEYLFDFSMSDLRFLLRHYSAELLFAFRLNLFLEFRERCSIAINDIWAMHAYQNGLYEKCGEFCLEVVRSIMQNIRSYEFVLPVSGIITHIIPAEMIALSACFILASNDMLRPVACQSVIAVSLFVLSLYKLEGKTASVIDKLGSLRTLLGTLDKIRIVDRLLLVFAYRKILLDIKRRTWHRDQQRLQ